MTLTNVEIKGFKPTDSPYKKSDGGGLHLLVQANGSKLWRLAYRFNGKQKLVSFGPYPAVSLIEAREKREEAKRILRDGKDPAAVEEDRKANAIRAQENTFAIAAREYIDRRKTEGVSENTAVKYEWFLGKVIDDQFRNQSLTDIRPRDIAELLRRVDASGRRETAHKLRMFIGAVFRLANLSFRVEGDPTAVLKGALPKRVRDSHYAAILEPAKLGALMDAIDAYDGWPTIRLALQFSAITFQRPGEIRAARWSEIDFDRKVWRLPAERMKMKLPHDVPLSRQSVSVLQRASDISSGFEHVFPQIRTYHRPISENAMNVALRRMGYSKDEHCTHGFRATATTILAEHGYREEVVQRQLAHTEPNEVRRAYNRAKYWEERVEMMQTWADMLDEFRSLGVNHPKAVIEVAV